MNSPILSVIIPAYNSASTIPYTLDSILLQECKKIEIIVVNDGSTDNTENICKDYCEKYSNIIYIHKKNSGVSETRNIGIKESNGKYIAFLDADDIWDKDYIDENLVNKLLRKNADLFVFSSCFTDNEFNIIEEVRVETQKLYGGDSAVDTFYQSFCSFIYKREFLLKYNLNFPTELSYGEDEVFRSKCLFLADRIIAEDKMSFYYRNNPYSSTKMNRKYKLFAKQKLEAFYLLKEFFYEQYRKNDENIVIKNGRTVSYFVNAISLLSESGYGYKNVLLLCDKENLSMMYNNNNKYYKLYYTDANIMDEFIQNSKKAYFKRRIRGLWYYPMANFKHKMMKRKING